MNDDIFPVLAQFESAAWIDSLPQYQKSSIEQLQAKGLSLDDIAETWLAAAAATTAPFSSGETPPKNPAFIAGLKDELAKFVCGDPKYKAERAKFSKEAKHAPTFVVSTISAAVAVHLNVAVAVLTPIVAIMLALIGQFTVNAWCATRGYP